MTTIATRGSSLWFFIAFSCFPACANVRVEVRKLYRLRLAPGLFVFNSMKFSASRRKVERAMKHIHDLNDLVVSFCESDFYAVAVKKYKGSNFVCIQFLRGLPKADAALIVGDALHNLRSALDILYFRALNSTTGKTGRYTKFPIFDDGEKLISSVNGGLKKLSLTDDPSAIKIRNFITDVIQPHEAGNWTLWALNEMSIMDKHQLLIPTFKVMRFTEISLQDDAGNIFLADGQPYYTEDSYRFKIERDGNLAVNDKGRAATRIVFSVGVPLCDQPVIPALTRIAEEVTRTIDAFEALDLHPFIDIETD
jgi:hypothetical protein